MSKKRQKVFLSANDVKLLNSKVGLDNLFAQKELDLAAVIKQTKADLALQAYSVELVKLLDWVIKNKKKIVVIFEGRDAAGKGGTIQQITKSINPRHFKIVALNKPSEEESGEWYFKRYIKRLPKAGEIVFFDRSWYNRAIVEPVNGFCSKKEYNIFMDHVNAFEEMLVKSDTQIIKIYLSISKKEQAKRFTFIKSKEISRWKISDVDRNAQKLWSEYTKFKNRMFKQTNTKHAPWYIINADDGLRSRITAIKHILKSVPYKN